MQSTLKPCYVFAGIDPGLDGGVAIIRTNYQNICTWSQVWPMPTKPGAKTREVDAVELSSYLNSSDLPLVVAIEIVHSMPKQGVASSFTFGKGYGKVLATIELLKVPILEVTPQRWKKTVLDGLGREKDDAIRFVMNTFPNIKLLKTGRSTKPHDGMAEALCIAEYARRHVFIAKSQGVS